jgi:hypothetical protein
MLSLTKQQKNQILQLIEQAKVNPRQFSWGVQASKFVTIFRDSAYLAAQGYEPDQAQSLTVQNTDYCFTFERNEEGEFYSFCNPHINVGNGIHAKAFDGLLSAFSEWLQVVKYELEEPDLWEMMDSRLPFSTAPKSYENKDRFSEPELEIITKQLEGIENFILKTNSLSKGEVTTVRNTFIYLQDRAATTTKLDWKNIFAGAIVSLLLSLAVENGRDILAFCNEALAPLFNGLLN